MKCLRLAVLPKLCIFYLCLAVWWSRWVGGVKAEGGEVVSEVLRSSLRGVKLHCFHGLVTFSCGFKLHLKTSSLYTAILGLCNLVSRNFFLSYNYYYYGQNEWNKTKSTCLNSKNDSISRKRFVIIEWQNNKKKTRRKNFFLNINFFLPDDRMFETCLVFWSRSHT